MYTHPGDDRPSPGTFSDIVQLISMLGLTPANLIAVIVDFRDEIPFGGPHAVIFDGLSLDEQRLGEMAFRTMAFADQNDLLKTLHAAGIHVHIDPEFNPVEATAGPAAGEPDTPKLPIPEQTAPVIIIEPDEEIVVAAPNP